MTNIHEPWPVLREYDQDHLARIALPLGGIGTGTISLGGRGDLRDWEVVNRPAKGFTPERAFFAINVQSDGREPITRALECPLDFSTYEGAFGSTAKNTAFRGFAMHDLKRHIHLGRSCFLIQKYLSTRDSESAHHRLEIVLSNNRNERSSCFRTSVHFHRNTHWYNFSTAS